MRTRPLCPPLRLRLPLKTFAVVAGLFLLLANASVAYAQGSSTQAQSANNAFVQAEAEFHVPQSLLKAICYMEGRLSNHGGNPSIDNGFGCMHLVKNSSADTLDQAAKDLGVSTSLLREDLATNIRGGAAILRDTALQLSPNHTLPTSLADWYNTVAAYSHATVNSTATMYADAVYALLRQGFTAQTDTGETVTLAPQAVQPNKATEARLSLNTALPGGCTNNTNVDYPGAVDCIVPQSFNCSANYNPCSYESANRPTNYSIDKIVIHDTEGSLQDALNIFQNASNEVSVQYLVDTNGTIYQLVRESDIAYHAGNYWYNQHSIGVEHVGYDAQGYQWYNATQYLASAKLVAYLLKKYHLPLDRTHIVAHGTLPSGSAATKNHFDPGPYWLWDYYFELIHQQGVPFPTTHPPANTITLYPQSDRQPDGPNGTETVANFNFFYLYTSASTRSSRIPQIDSTDITDVSNSVEPGIPYAFVAKTADAAGTGDMMYEIWYGETDRAQNTPPSYFSDGHLAWLDVPAGDGVEGSGSSPYGQLALRSQNGSTPQIYARPTSNSAYIIGGAPTGTAFAIGETFVEDGTSTLWYEINFNHRQAWVPASEMTQITYRASQTYTAMAPNSDGHLEAFALSTDNTIYHNYQMTPNGTWTGWTALQSGQKFNGDPVMGVNANGMLEAFARSSNNNIWTTWQNTVNDSTSWASWVALPSGTTHQFQGTPSVIQESNGCLEVVARLSDGTIWQNYQKTPEGFWNGWSEIQPSGPAFNGDPVVSMNANGMLEIFARGSDNNIWTTWQNTVSNNTSWASWVALPSGSSTKYQFQGTPSAALNSDGRLEIVARLSNGTIWQNYQKAPEGFWSGWLAVQTSGQTFNGDPMVSTNADGRLEIFAVGSDNNLYHTWETVSGSSTSWFNWGLLQSGPVNSFQGTPAVTTDAGGRLIINVVGPVNSSNMWMNYQNTPNGSWGGWFLAQPNAQFQP